MSLVSLDRAVVMRGKTAALNGLSIELAGGELLGLIGPNGSGKTTALRAVLGLVSLSGGRALIGQADVAQVDSIARARQVAYLPQIRPVAWPISVRDTVALGRFAYGTSAGKLAAADQQAVDDAISACDLEHLKDRAVTSLSGGEAARVHMARALAAQTPALLADEPTAALDPLNQWSIMQVLANKAKQGAGVMVVVHDLALAAQFCTRLILIKDGALLASGTPETVLTPALIAQAYGVKAHWHHDDFGPKLIVGGPTD
jgi:iron complex transport system ATP-binding protein